MTKDDLTPTKYTGKQQTITANTARASELVARASAEMALANRPEADRVPLRELGRIKAVAAEYLNDCAANGFLPTVRGLASWLGYSRSALYKHSEAYPNSDFAEYLRDFSDLCGEITLSAANENLINVVGGIFTAKSRFGFKEQPTQLEIVQNNIPIGPALTPEEIAAKYADLPED